MLGYYYNSKSKRYDHGNHPQASSTIEGAMAARGDKMVPDYSPDYSKGTYPQESAEDTSSNSGNSAAAGGAKAAEKLAEGADGDTAVASGLMATGNPYAMAGGAALLTAKSINDARYQDALARYQGAERGLTTGLGGQFKI